MDKYLNLMILSYSLPLSDEIISTLSRRDQMVICRMVLESKELLTRKEIKEILSFDFFNDSVEKAIMLSNLPLVKRLLSPKSNSSKLLYISCFHSNLKTILYLLDNLSYDPTEILYTSSRSQYSYEILKVLHSKGADLSRYDFFHCSIRRGNYQEVRYLIDNETKPYRIFLDTSRLAADRGYLDILQYIHSLGHEFGHAELQYACLHGHLHIVEYLHSLGVDLSHETSISWALAKNQFNVIKYLLDQGVAPEMFDFLHLIRVADEEVIPTFDYLLSRGVPFHVLEEDTQHCSPLLKEHVLNHLRKTQTY